MLETNGKWPLLTVQRSLALSLSIWISIVCAAKADPITSSSQRTKMPITSNFPSLSNSQNQSTPGFAPGARAPGTSRFNSFASSQNSMPAPGVPSRFESNARTSQPKQIPTTDNSHMPSLANTQQQQPSRPHGNPLTSHFSTYSNKNAKFLNTSRVPQRFNNQNAQPFSPNNKAQQNARNPIEKPGANRGVPPKLTSAPHSVPPGIIDLAHAPAAFKAARDKRDYVMPPRDAAEKQAKVLCDKIPNLVRGEPHSPQAVALARKAVAIAPGYARAWNALGMAVDNRREALNSLKKSVSIDPYYLDSWVELGTLSAYAGRHQDCEFAFNQVLRLVPGNSKYTKAIAHTYIELGKPELAAIYFEKSAQANPKDVDALSWLGWSCDKMRRPSDADGYYKRALECDSSNEFLLRSYGSFLVLQNRLPEADKMFTRLNLVHPESTKGWLAMGDLRHAQSNDDAARCAYQMVAKKNSKCPDGLVAEAQIEIEHRNLKQAHALLDKATAISPGDSYVWFQSGRLYFFEDKLNEAAKCFLTATKKDPNNSQAWENLAQVYAKQGNKAAQQDALNMVAKTASRR